MSSPKGITRVFAATLAALAKAAALAALAGLGARAARADGAFPDSIQIVLPADRPHQIVLSTNFGLMISDDDGATWTWTCEQDQTANAALYTVGPPPLDRFFGLSARQGVAYSDDDSCTWHTAGGTLTDAIPSDFFPDPTDVHRVWAIGSVAGDGGGIAELFRSDDGGVTFGPPLFAAPLNGGLSGVESARSDPNIVYLAMYTSGLNPSLVRSSDAGAHWETVDLQPMLGPMTTFGIMAVDPVDPRTLYLRVTEPLAETVAVSHDGGDTFTRPVRLAGGILRAFVRMPSGTLLVGAIVDINAVGFRSTDGGNTFGPWPGVPHLEDLAERDGKLYAAAKNYTDQWAIGVSSDEGLTFTPLAMYSDVRAIRACAQATCQDSCDKQAGSGLWQASVCYANADGGAGGHAGDGGKPPPAKSGCGCHAAPGSGSGGWRGAPAALLVLAVTLALRHARRRRRRR